MLKNCTIVDLTHTLDKSIPTWSGSCGFKAHTLIDYNDGLKVQEYFLSAGIGTHMDAPAHFIPHAQSISEIELTKLIAPLRFIDVSLKADALYEITVEDIKNHENRYGAINKNNFVLFYTGWSKHWPNIHNYRNLNKNNTMEFPTLSLESAEYLLKRNIVGIGIDTLSPDKDGSHFPVHHILLKAHKYIVENVDIYDNLPAKGATIVIAPLKIKDGTESPVRIFALL